MRRQTLALIFLGLAVGTWAVLHFASPMKPEQAMAAGFAQLSHAKQISGVASVALLLPAEKKGDIDNREPLALRGVFQISIPDAGAVATNLNFATVGTDGQAGMKANVRGFSDAATYFKLESKSDATVGGLSLATLADFWWKLDKPVWELFSKPLLAKTKRDTKPDSAFTADSWRRLRDLVFGGTMFVTDGAVLREYVGSILAYRYNLGITLESAVSFAKNLREAMSGQPLSAEEAVLVEHDALTHSFALIVWLDPKTGHVLQAKINLKDAGETGMSQTILFENIDTETAVTVQVPAEAKDFAAIGKKPTKATKP